MMEIGSFGRFGLISTISFLTEVIDASFMSVGFTNSGILGGFFANSILDFLRSEPLFDVECRDSYNVCP
jgi:hypothetical protein